jgi:hypothetical protein
MQHSVTDTSKLNPAIMSIRNAKKGFQKGDLLTSTLKKNHKLAIMTNANDFGTRRVSTGYTVNYPNNQLQYVRQGQYAAGGAVMQPGHPDGMANIAHGFGAMTLSNSPFATRGNSHVPASNNEYAGAMSINNGAYHVQGGQAAMLYAGNHIVQGAPNGQGANNMYAQHANHYMHPQAFGNHGMVDMNSPAAAAGSSGWTTRVASDGSLIPSLNHRRGSISSNEEQVPSTPYNQLHTFATQYNGVTIIDRSPSNAFTTNNSTPSPSQFLSPYGLQKYTTPPISMQMQMLLKQEPVIPSAIPAPSSPVKPLDRCLENKNGETNVYIRGLLPETTDEMLHAWGGRFGDIQSSKSIIDHKTGMCKG